MSSLTSLGVNKNSTRFAPKVKARQARRPPPPSKQESPAAAVSAPTAPAADKNNNDANSGSSQVDPSLSVTASGQQRQQEFSSVFNTSVAPVPQDSWNADRTPFDTPAVMTPGRPVQTPTPFDVSSPTFVDTPSPFTSVATPRRMSSDTEDVRSALPQQHHQPPAPPQVPEAPAAVAPVATAVHAPQKTQSERSASKRPRVARRGGAAPIVAPSRHSNRPPAVGSSSSSAATAIIVGESNTWHNLGDDDDNDDDDTAEGEQSAEKRKGKRPSKKKKRQQEEQEEQQEQQEQPRARKKRQAEMDPSEWQTLDDIQGDPAPASYMERPMSYFLRDLQTGIVSKAFKEREIEERELKKRMENEIISKEEMDRLATLKREAEERKRAEAEAKRVEEERRKEQESKVLRETNHAPQVRLINGQIVLDADSLVLERANEDQAIDLSTLEVVEENNMTRRVNSRTFSNQVHSARWSKLETEEFYDAIAQCGTDFTMAAHLLPGRTRNQVRLKFNREEKSNPDRVKEVLVRKRKPMDIDRVQKAIGKEFEALPESFYGENNDELQ